ncbi:MAG: alpha/beta hydrolase [Woeseiaceae bacterium]|jgi:alpha-beta hydrolase superfamily lysophospholipase
MVHHTRQLLRAQDGHEIPLHAWRPDGDCRCVIQLVHGLGEYAARYQRFAEAAAVEGYAVCAHDQRGHGPDAEQQGFLGPGHGWQKLIEDIERVNQYVHAEFEALPVILLGHSMGSYVAQNFAMYHGPRIDGLILSASTWPSRLRVLTGLLVAHVESFRLAPHKYSGLLHFLGFSSFNGPFKPARTEFDWLSRDEQEVDAYINDPLCGGPYTCSLWVELARGLLRISSDHELLRIPSDLPILITGGEKDPVGGEKGMGKLALHYAQTGHQRLKVKIYKDGRHEMLNEVNRDQVMRDWFDWLATTTRNWRSG